MSQELFGHELALSYALKDQALLKEKLKRSNRLVVKERIRNQEHVEKILLLNKLLQHKDKQILSLTLQNQEYKSSPKRLCSLFMEGNYKIAQDLFDLRLQQDNPDQPDILEALSVKEHIQTFRSLVQTQVVKLRGQIEQAKSTIESLTSQAERARTTFQHLTESNHAKQMQIATLRGAGSANNSQCDGHYNEKLQVRKERIEPMFSQQDSNREIVEDIKLVIDCLLKQV